MFLIVDGNSLLNIQYHGQKHASIYDRKDASDAVIDIILKYLKKYPVLDHVCVVLDASREETFRRSLYAPYKAHRDEAEEELKKEKIALKEKLTKMGIITLMHPVFEADDFAGTLVKKFSKDDKIVLLTRDQDYLQLIQDRICLWLIKDEKKVFELSAKYGEQGKVNQKTYAYGKNICYQEYGIYPEQISDFKGICGDTADNIPGINGLGPKIAVPLLNEYKTLENIIFEIENKEKSEIKKEWKQKFGIGPAKVEKLYQGIEMGILSKRLATIFQDIPNGFRYEDFTVPERLW